MREEAFYDSHHLIGERNFHASRGAGHRDPRANDPGSNPGHNPERHRNGASPLRQRPWCQGGRTRAIRNKIFDETLDFEEIFITSKLANTHHGPGQVKECLQSTLITLGVPYIHLYLVHSPCGIKPTDGDNLCPDGVDILDTWRQMEALVDDKLVKSIGLANFNARQITRILKGCRIKPALLQIECHIYFQNRDIIRFCRSKSIRVSAYGPFGCPGRLDKDPDEQLLLSDPAIAEVASRTKGKSVAQVALRFLQQSGLPVVTRAIIAEHQLANLEIFDFHLSDADMNRLRNLDKNQRVITLLSLRSHPEYPFVEVSGTMSVAGFQIGPANASHHKKIK